MVKTVGSGRERIDHCAEILEQLDGDAGEARLPSILEAIAVKVEPNAVAEDSFAVVAKIEVSTTLTGVQVDGGLIVGQPVGIRHRVVGARRQIDADGVGVGREAIEAIGAVEAGDKGSDDPRRAIGDRHQRVGKPVVFRIHDAVAVLVIEHQAGERAGPLIAEVESAEDLVDSQIDGGLAVEGQVGVVGLDGTAGHTGGIDAHDVVATREGGESVIAVAVGGGGLQWRTEEVQQIDGDAGHTELSRALSARAVAVEPDTAAELAALAVGRGDQEEKERKKEEDDGVSALRISTDSEHRADLSLVAGSYEENVSAGPQRRMKTAGTRPDDEHLQAEDISRRGKG